MRRTPEELTIDTGQRRLTVRLRRSIRARRLQIQVGHDGAEIVLPRRGAVREAEQFLCERAKWVLAKISQFRAVRAEAEREAVLPDSAILLGGEWMPLRVITGSGRGGSVRVEGGAVVLQSAGGAGAEVEGMMEDWLRRRGRERIVRCVERWSGAMGVGVGRIFIRDQRTRWASCSSAGNVSFSWRLVCAPPDVLNYIVVHELAHLVHMNHSRRFWRVVESHCGEIGRYRRWFHRQSWLMRQPIRLGGGGGAGKQLNLWPGEEKTAMRS